MLTRRNFLKVAGAGLAALPAFGNVRANGDKKPNFVWLVSEDNSMHFMNLFHQNGAETPRIRQLAENGVVFTHAFSNCPVCSAARSTLATSCYASRIGTQFHRKSQEVPLPGSLRPFHTYLRRAGYFTSNKKKTDYNFIAGDESWQSEEDWRQRQPGQPFFHMQSFPNTHESCMHAKAMLESPAGVQVKIPPIHPDTETFRKSYAHYLRQMSILDNAIGTLVDELNKDGLIEDTFIFYFADNGGVLPGSKGYAYETGLHIPLVVRIPENWRHLVNLKRNSRAEGFVSFIDFGPTLLHLAGIDVPAGVDGRPFMGTGITAEDFEKRDETFGMADRFDEKYDLVRTFRKGRLKYIRNYQPFNFDGLHNDYRYKMAAYVDWRTLYLQGKLNKTQSRFFESRDPEALYDVEADPYETNNLAGDPAYRDRLIAMRSRLSNHIKSLPDLSLYPESCLSREAFANPVDFGQKHKAEIAKLVDIADLSLSTFAAAKAGIMASLSSENRWERYWGLIACSSHGKADPDLSEKAKAMAEQDPELLVRVRAAEYLGLTGTMDPRPVIMDVLSKTEHPLDALLTLNTLVLLQDGKPGYKFSISSQDVKAKNNLVNIRLRYLANA